MVRDHLIEAGYSSVNGIRMYYERYGDDGNYLVLIHGGGSTIETSFGNVIPVLAKNNKVVALELQAHGRTEDRDAPERFEQDAEDVAMLLKNLEIDKASILGFSNGGNVAMQMAIRHPELLDRLLLASTFYQKEGLLPGFLEGMSKSTLEDMPEALVNAFLAVNPDRHGLETMFRKDQERMLSFKDWEDEMLQSIQAPTLIIHGDQDVILPEHAMKMARLIPDARLMILPASHGSYFGVAESTPAGDTIVALTAAMVNDFLHQ